VVAKAPPDGYLLLINSNAHSVNPAIYAKLPYDTLKDSTEVAPFAMQPNVLVVNTGSQYQNLMDLVNEARAKPGVVNWGHAGLGSGTHLNTEKFIAAANVKVTQVPFKGTPEVIQAMFSNSVDCYWVPISAGMAHIKSGKLRPLAVSTAKRNPTLPDVGDIRKALADATVKERLANLGNDTMDMPAQEFARFVRSEIGDYQRVVRAAGIKPQ
jgi:tripartite-type tricarboxylate transporter receptor subunit TctC